MADVSVDLFPRASLGMKADRLPMGPVLGQEKQALTTAEAAAVQPLAPTAVQEPAEFSAALSPTAKPTLSGKEIEALIKRGREAIVAGNIDAARLALQLAAEAGNATAAAPMIWSFFEKSKTRECLPARWSNR